MKGKEQGKFQQANLLQKSLMEQLNPKEPLLILVRHIPWDTLCAKYYGCYAGTGRPAKPIRLMLDLLLLKQLENLSDEASSDDGYKILITRHFAVFMNFNGNSLVSLLI